MNIDRIRKRLEELDWSNADLAERIGVTPSRVSKILAQRTVSIATLVKVAQALDLPASEIANPRPEPVPEDAPEWGIHG